MNVVLVIVVLVVVIRLSLRLCQYWRCS